MKLQSYIFLVLGLAAINLGLISHNTGWLNSVEPYTVNMEFLQLVKAPDNNRIVLENKHEHGMYWHLTGPEKQQGFVSKHQLSKRMHLPDGDYILTVSASPFDQAALWEPTPQDLTFEITLKDGLMCRASIESI